MMMKSTDGAALFTLERTARLLAAEQRRTTVAARRSAEKWFPDPTPDDLALVRLDRPLREAVAAARRSVLTEAQAIALGAFAADADWHDRFRATADYTFALSDQRRTVFRKLVGFALFTVEWQASLARLLDTLVPRQAGPNARNDVLDVCAGYGFMADSREFQARDGNPARCWHCTDADPPRDASVNIHRVGATSALRRPRPAWRGRVGAIFASWLPMSFQDVNFARECAARRLPLVLVGEPPGGCTGTPAMSDTHVEFALHYATDLLPDFRDVPQWNGLHDCTMVVLPRDWKLP